MVVFEGDVHCNNVAAINYQKHYFLNGLSTLE